MNELILFGCGGHSRSVADVILYNNQNENIIFVDDNARNNEMIFGFNVESEIHINADSRCFLCDGNNVSRKNKYTELDNFNVITVVSKLAHMGRNVSIGRGTFVAHSCHLGPDVSVGENSIINTASVIDHEVTIGSHSHIGPNASVSGRTKIGDQVFIGVGACVVDNINICSNTIIGANSTVISSIEEPGIYVGNPVRKIK